MLDRIYLPCVMSWEWDNTAIKKLNNYSYINQKDQTQIQMMRLSITNIFSLLIFWGNIERENDTVH